LILAGRFWRQKCRFQLHLPLLGLAELFADGENDFLLFRQNLFQLLEAVVALGSIL
jgi:hypothetical protein